MLDHPFVVRRATRKLASVYCKGTIVGEEAFLVPFLVLGELVPVQIPVHLRWACDTKTLEPC